DDGDVAEVARVTDGARRRRAPQRVERERRQLRTALAEDADRRVDGLDIVVWSDVPDGVRGPTGATERGAVVARARKRQPGEVLCRGGRARRTRSRGRGDNRPGWVLLGLGHLPLEVAARSGRHRFQLPDVTGELGRCHRGRRHGLDLTRLRLRGPRPGTQGDQDETKGDAKAENRPCWWSPRRSGSVVLHAHCNSPSRRSNEASRVYAL